MEVSARQPALHQKASRRLELSQRHRGLTEMKNHRSLPAGSEARSHVTCDFFISVHIDDQTHNFRDLILVASNHAGAEQCSQVVGTLRGRQAAGVMNSLEVEPSRNPR